MDEVFLQAILDAPDDDTPRLIYADWLIDQGNPRGEFIHVQCRLARMDSSDPQRPQLEQRERDLLRRHQDEWLGQVRPLVSRWTFRRGFLDEVAVLARTFAAQDGFPRPATVRRIEVDLTGAEIPRETLLLLPENVARENLVFPLADRAGRLLVAISNPDNWDTLQKLQFIINRDIEPLPAPAEQILEAIERHRGQYPPDEPMGLIDDFVDVAIDWPTTGDEAPTVTLVNLILREAIVLHATEIRIEPQVDRLVVLYRIAGEWIERDSPPRRLLGLIATRLRTMAGLDAPAEQGEQTGNIHIHIQGLGHHEVDLTITPTDLGPRIVCAL
jgi:uncharacterized protein (TIGR02996 family)